MSARKFFDGSLRTRSASLIAHKPIEMRSALSVSASSYLSWNRSSQEIFNYQAANAGGGITATIRF